MERRQFLRIGLGAAAGSVLPQAIGCGAALRGRCLPDPADSGIEHVIVTMMENRSFDHWFGWLPNADGKQAGLTYADRAGVSHSTYPLAPRYSSCGSDPDHSDGGGRTEY